MKNYKTAAIGLLGLAASVAASAAPPPGSHELLRPTVSRYAVTLVANTRIEGQGSCPHPAQRELALVTLAGKIVQAPFVVPMLSSFVLTDVTWWARPRRFNGVPGKPFDPAQQIYLSINRRSSTVSNSDDGVFVPADRVFPTYAAGKQSFTTGNSYGMYDVLCAAVLLPDDFGGEAADLTAITVYGYVDDWSRVE
jgi:hypothetical protein